MFIGKIINKIKNLITADKQETFEENLTQEENKKLNFLLQLNDNEIQLYQKDIAKILENIQSNINTVRKQSSNLLTSLLTMVAILAGFAMNIHQEIFKILMSGMLIYIIVAILNPLISSSKIIKFQRIVSNSYLLDHAYFAKSAEEKKKHMLIHFILQERKIASNGKKLIYITKKYNHAMTRFRIYNLMILTLAILFIAFHFQQIPFGKLLEVKKYIL